VISAVLVNNRLIGIIEVKMARQLISCRFAAETTVGPALLDREKFDWHTRVSLKKGEDGSLTLYIQRDSPGADKEPNWLPAPDDLIYLAMRLYWPKTEPPSVLPPGEGTWQPPGIKKWSKSRLPTSPRKFPGVP